MSFDNRTIIRTALPVLASLLMEHLIGITDTAFLGRVGEAQLAASVLANIFYMIIFVVGAGFSTGAQIIIARRNGEQNFSAIGKVFYSGVGFQLMLAAALFLLTQLLAPWLLRQLIVSEAIYEQTVHYVTWRVWGLFFIFTILMFRAFFIGITQTHILSIAAVVTVAANILLNYLLIFGHWGLPALGIRGAAIASALAEMTGCFFFVVYSLYRVDIARYGLRKFDFEWAILGRVFNISVWTMLQSFLAISIWFVFFLAVERLGERPLAVVNLIRTCAIIPFLFTNAFASVTNSLISNLIGAGEQDQIYRLINRTTLLALLFVGPVLLFVLLLPQLSFMLYTDNMELVNAAAASAWIMVLASLVQVPAFIWLSAVSGTGNTKFTLIIESATLAIYTVSVIYFVSYLKGGITLAWSTELIYQIFLLGFSLLYMTSGRWRGKTV